MKVIFGTLIFFFYFVKYPIVIILPIAYFNFGFEYDITMNILAFISILLIINDLFFPHEKPKNCQGAKR